MNTLEAFARSQETPPDARARVFDWMKAVNLIKKHGATYAEAGLQNDMEWTGGVILSDGEPDMDSLTYLASNWAVPIIVIDGEEIECWSYVDEVEYTQDTKWPMEALEELKNEVRIS